MELYRPEFLVIRALDAHVGRHKHELAARIEAVGESLSAVTCANAVWELGQKGLAKPVGHMRGAVRLRCKLWVLTRAGAAALVGLTMIPWVRTTGPGVRGREA